MLFLCLTAWLLTTQLHFVKVQGVECPLCTDKYDHNSCTQTHSCEADVNYCELMVKPDDFYSLDYVCKKALDCTKQATDECHPTNNETCIYCCEGPTICQIQRDHLYNNQFPSSGLLVPSTTTAGPIESTSAKLSASTSTESPATSKNPSTTASTESPATSKNPSTTASTGGVMTSTPTAVVTTPTPAISLPANSVVIECPVCTDAYDHTTCSGLQNCVGAEAVCQLVIHTTGQLQLKYQCGHFEVCGGQEAAGCRPEVNETCVYCCTELLTCQLQRDDLFTYELPSLGIATDISATIDSTATTAATTAATETETKTTTAEATTRTTKTATTTTVRPTEAATETTARATVATETTTATTTTRETTATEATATKTTTTETTATASPTQQTPATTISPPTAIRCLQCGNFADHIPCTQYEIAVNSPKSCPGYLPFCFTSFTQNGTDVVVYKGCATENFCNSQYEESSTKKECNDPDLESSKDVSCGYCCNRHYCNTVLKPDESSLVVFP